MLQDTQIVMVSPTPKKQKNGFTLVEMLIVIALILIVISTSFILIQPAEQRRKARDVARLSDLSSIETAINEYRVDTGSYPDSVNLERKSTSLPDGNSGPFVKCSDGWIDTDLCAYLPKLFVDPMNDDTYFYSYKSTEASYELNASLEYQTELMTEDGGNADTKYELGNNKALL